MNINLRAEILEKLEAHRQRCTYGALAEVVGGIGRGVMQDQPRSHRNSFIVRQRGGLPTGYDSSERHPELLLNSRVIKTGAGLQVWLKTA